MSPKPLLGFLTLLLFFLVPFSPAQAKDARSISVTGLGTVPVTPDQVELTVGIEVSDRDVQASKKKSDDVMRKILAVASAKKIAQKDIQSDYVLIEADRSGALYSGQKAPEEAVYRARRTVRILLRNLSQYESLVTSLFDAGANTLSDVQFRSSKEEALQSDAKIKAMKNARQNAELLATESGLKLGKPLSISDSERPSLPMAVSMKYSAASMEMAAPTLAIGEIGINSTVHVVFEAE